VVQQEQRILTISALPYSKAFSSGRIGNSMTVTVTIVTPTPVGITSLTGSIASVPTSAPKVPVVVVPVPTIASKAPTKTPIRSPTTAPIRSPTKVPIRPPTTAPIRSPTKVPIRLPTNAPIRSPTKAPVRPPTKSPTRRPTKLPTRRPTLSPVTGVTSSYDITLNLIGSGLTQTDVTTFQTAAARWKQIVVGDVQDIPYNGYSLPFAGCTAPSVIDDLLICGQVAPIDGEYNVVGYAGPTWTRGNNIPFIGQMVFDSADVAMMKQTNSFYNVILHEMGHVLGIGTIWQRTGVTGTPAENCPYKGINGNREYSTVSGCTGRSLPIELDGGEGTRCGHFDEECFKDELMTGYATGTMPISRLTVATLQDVGYTVNYDKADPYTKANMDPTCVCTARNLRQLKIVKLLDTPQGRSSSATTKKISNEGFQKARDFGKKILMQGRRNFNNSNQPGVEQYVGADFITVIYNEEGNGIFGVVVTSADLDV
jgi:Leishmanolysin